MEGPTPVSALLHAATMVTAGVYLLIRTHSVFDYLPEIMLLIGWIGGLSALGGAIGGLLEQDIKKIIAYSTISQLGYMFIAIGFAEYNLSLWHLVNHACFKALLFLSGGALIHSIFGIQDIRKFGSVQIPALQAAFLIGNLSIMAIPFMTGWWTKDQILLEVFKYNSFLFLLIYLAAIITAAYSIKLFLSCFKSLPRLSYNVFNLINIGEASLMLFSIGTLAFLAIVLGYLTSNVYSLEG
jgi:NADH-ubiquinone oxidoreductase chain 5